MKNRSAVLPARPAWPCVVSAESTGPRVRRALALGFSLALLLPQPPAAAQFADRPGFLAPFLSLFGGGRPRSYAPPSYREQDLDRVPQITVRPRPATREEDEGDDRVEGDGALGPRAFCVRLCDGFYFPVGPAAGGKTAQAQAHVCSNLCPAADVALYSLRSGGDVADAVGPQGRRYASLDTAFRFRTELPAGCTCNGKPGGGLAALDPANDFTLRRGDIIAGATGPLVFSGGGRLPFRADQFSPAPSHHLSREMMRRFLSTRSSRTSASPRQVDDLSPDIRINDEPSRPKGPVRVVPLTTADKAELP